MILKTQKLWPASALGLLLVLGACTDDKKKADEAVKPTTAEQPASPPEPPSNDVQVEAENVYFRFDNYTLEGDQLEKLNKLAEQLKSNPGVSVQIEGHCDERGSPEYNLALGERRAQSVKKYLAGVGVDSARLSTISYGEEKPLAEGHGEESWSKNRRAQFVISK